MPPAEARMWAADFNTASTDEMTSCCASALNDGEEEDHSVFAEDETPGELAASDAGVASECEGVFAAGPSGDATRRAGLEDFAALAEFAELAEANSNTTAAMQTP